MVYCHSSSQPQWLLPRLCLCKFSTHPLWELLACTRGHPECHLPLAYSPSSLHFYLAGYSMWAWSPQYWQWFGYAFYLVHGLKSELDCLFSRMRWPTDITDACFSASSFDFVGHQQVHSENIKIWADIWIRHIWTYTVKLLQAGSGQSTKVGPWMSLLLYTWSTCSGSINCNSSY